MSRKLNPVSSALALVLLFAAAYAALAQTRLESRRVPVEVQARAATLGCCKCLGGTNMLDLSTVSTNAWTVNGGPAFFLPAPNVAWNLNPGPAQWVSTAANGVTGVAAGTYEYRLNFIVPECAIGQRVTLTGNYGGDNTVAVFLDNASGQSDASNPDFVAQCPRIGYCFSSVHNPSLPSFSRAVGPGNHVLIVKVQNDGGPSGMFVNAKLVGACRGE
jgi:hypothetical protein